MWFGGDSISVQLNTGLRGRAHAAGITSYHSHCQTSTGLINSWYFDWFTQLRHDMSTYHPQITAFLIGTNDWQALRTSTGSSEVNGSPAWIKEYRRRIADAVQIMLHGGVQRIYWIGLPPMRSGRLNQRIATVNRIVRSVVTRYPRVTYVELWSHFDTPRGGFDARWRLGDGVHFDTAGIHRALDVVWAAIRKGSLAG
jgi:hypothetical protein